MPIIISETRRGSMCAHNAFACNDEQDFVSRIRELVRRKGIDERIDSVEDAADYLDECHAQSTRVITEEEFRETLGWDSAVVRVARTLGWVEEPCEEGDEL